MSQSLLTPEALLEHWQGHRRLTLRTVEAFPEAKLFDYTVVPMRSFGKMMVEILEIEVNFLHSVLSGDWVWQPKYKSVFNKEALLTVFKETAQTTRAVWTQLTPERIEAVEIDAGGAEKPNRERLLYMIDNEIHHRAQGYVYLRLLGIEPPAFYER